MLPFHSQSPETTATRTATRISRHVGRGKTCPRWQHNWAGAQTGQNASELTALGDVGGESISCRRMHERGTVMQSGGGTSPCLLVVCLHVCVRKRLQTKHTRPLENKRRNSILAPFWHFTAQNVYMCTKKHMGGLKRTCVRLH